MPQAEGPTPQPQPLQFQGISPEGLAATPETRAAILNRINPPLPAPETGYLRQQAAGIRDFTKQQIQDSKLPTIEAPTPASTLAKGALDQTVSTAGKIFGAMDPNIKAQMLAQGMSVDEVERIDQAGQLYTSDAFQGRAEGQHYESVSTTRYSRWRRNEAFLPGYR